MFKDFFEVPKRRIKSVISISEIINLFLNGTWVSYPNKNFQLLTKEQFTMYHKFSTKYIHPHNNWKQFWYMSILNYFDLIGFGMFHCLNNVNMFCFCFINIFHNKFIHFCVKLLTHIAISSLFVVFCFVCFLDTVFVV